MIEFVANDKHVLQLLDVLPKQASRAAEKALDKTAKDIKLAEVAEMKRVFDNPTRFTLSSLKVTHTKNHNMIAKVGFKSPDRMGQHYITPQVDGGARKFKGFEHAFGKKMFVPGQAARMTKAGNVSRKQIQAVISAVKKKEHGVYVPIYKRRGRLHPGVYQRVRRGSAGVRSGTSRVNQRGRKRGRFASAVLARGLRPIMLEGKQRAPIKPLLAFYEVADKIQRREFRKHFDKSFAKLVRS